MAELFPRPRWFPWRSVPLVVLNLIHSCPVNLSSTIGGYRVPCSMVHATVGIRAAGRRRGARTPTIAWTMKKS